MDSAPMRRLATMEVRATVSTDTAKVEKLLQEGLRARASPAERLHCVLWRVILSPPPAGHGTAVKLAGALAAAFGLRTSCGASGAAGGPCAGSAGSTERDWPGVLRVAHGSEVAAGKSAPHLSAVVAPS